MILWITNMTENKICNFNSATRSQIYGHLLQFMHRNRHTLPWNSACTVPLQHQTNGKRLPHLSKCGGRCWRRTVMPKVQANQRSLTNKNFCGRCFCDEVGIFSIELLGSQLDSNVLSLLNLSARNFWKKKFCGKKFSRAGI